MVKKLLVFGSSGHAKDVIACAGSLGYREFQLVSTDGSSAVPGMKALREADFDPDSFSDWDCIVAIGHNGHRRRFHEDYPGLNFTRIVASSAVVCDTASLGKGTFIGAFAYVGPDAQLGEACIVNTHSIIGHDSRVGDFSQVGPQVCISGHVEIGHRVFIGAGSVFNNGSGKYPLRIADDVSIGMGCLVTHSVATPGLRLVPKVNHTKLRADLISV
jgi:sugar O-acyltransferase (sialic acid O-acetyltransferase NeuD family)